MKGIKHICIIVFLLLFYQNSREQNTTKFINKGKLLIYDSIIVPTGNLKIYDYCKNKQLYLGTNYNSKEVILFDKKGTIKHKFNRFGEGPEEYRQSDPFIAKFWLDNTIVVLRGNVFVNYTYDGNFIRIIKLDNEPSLLSRRNVNICLSKTDDTCIIYYADKITSKRSINADFYNDTSYKFFYYIDLNKGIKKRIITYEDNSIYRNNDYYYPVVTPKAYINEEKGVLDVLFAHDTKLYRYDIYNNFKLLSTIDLKPDYFGELNGLPYGKRLANPIPFIMSNSKYLTMALNADTLFLWYSQYLSEDKLFTSIEQVNENAHTIPKYIQCFINGEKLFTDIKVPSNILGIGYFHSLNRIILNKSPNEYDEMNNTVTFYICKIKFQ